MKNLYKLSVTLVMALFLVFTFMFVGCERKRDNRVEQLILENTINETGQNSSDKSDAKNEVGVGIFSPYVDVTSWVPISSAYSINGAPNLLKLKQETGINSFHLGFVQPDQSNPLESNGDIRWCWGGYYKLSEKGNDGFQYIGIKKSIDDFMKSGGSIVISFGGQLGKAPWLVTNNVQKLANMYKDVIEFYNLKRIDLDIEESNQGTYVNSQNAKAVKMVQDQTGVEVSLTIPIMPWGWDTKQINLIKAYMDEGVDIKIINSMTMCYGKPSLNAGEDFGSASVRAMENACSQLIEIYAGYGKKLSESESYKRLGSTVSLGYEGPANEVFTPTLAQKVYDHAAKKKYGLLSYWSINRDSKIEENLGVTGMYSFSKIYKNFDKTGK